MTTEMPIKIVATTRKVEALSKQTNADRIRSMSIDKLIEWYCYHRDCGLCPYGGIDCGIREWLEQECTK